MPLSSSFLEYLKKVESGGKVGWDSSKELWFPHASPEGGNDTIAYGHKLLDSEVEQANEGLTDDEVEQMLIKDLDTAEYGAKNILQDHFNEDFDDLSEDKQEMLIDFDFNLGSYGLKRFPKFVGAVCSDDKDTLCKEYKRYFTDGFGAKKELKQRNEEFYKLFLA